MNFLPARVAERKLSLPIADVDLTDDVIERIGKHKVLIAGIRPEHFEDASLVDADKQKSGVTFEAAVDVTEWLGNEQFAYIPFEAPKEITDQLKDLARELDSESLRTQLVVSIDTASRVGEGKSASFWFDPRRI